MKLKNLLRAAFYAAVALLVAACGGGGNSGTAQLRVVNAIDDVSSIDLYANSSEMQASVAAKSVSGYADLASGTYTMSIQSAGSATVLSASSRNFSKDTHYTMVAYGHGAAINAALLSDEQAAPASGTTLIRVFNTSSSVGPLAVYLTGSTTDLSTATPALAVPAATISGYAQVSQGSYRLRITGNGDTTDLRLDLPTVTLGDQQVVTLILTPGSGGVLVHALALNQQGTMTVLDNTQARLRVVSSVAGNGAVTASVAGNTLTTSQRSPAVGAYALVPAGTQTLAASVNGQALSTTSITTVAGADLTLLVYGTASVPAASLLVDDNSLPTDTSKAKLRLVHGVSSQGSGLSLTLNYGVVASNLAVGAASTPVAVASGTSNTLEVDSPLTATALYSASSVTLSAEGVYTVFLLDGSTNPVGVLRLDR